MGYTSFVCKNVLDPCRTRTSRYGVLVLLVALLALFLLPSPRAWASEHVLSGKATWYGTSAHGKLTANGERFNRQSLTAAHLTLPFDTVIRVYNLRNGKQILVRITDRGPFGKGRVVDLSMRSAQLLRMTDAGVAPVAMEIVAEKAGKPTAAGNSFYLHLASEKEVPLAHKASSDLHAAIGLPVRALFSAQEGHLGFVLCAGPYSTFAEAEAAFLKVEKVRPVLGIIEGPTDGGYVPKHVPPVIQKRPQGTQSAHATR